MLQLPGISSPSDSLFCIVMAGNDCVVRLILQVALSQISVGVSLYMPYSQVVISGNHWASDCLYTLYCVVIEGNHRAARQFA